MSFMLMANNEDAYTLSDEEKSKLKFRVAQSNIIYDLIDKELEFANERFGGFNSLHEAYAVVLEEYEEMMEEVESVTAELDILWKRTKSADDSPQQREISQHNLMRMKRYAVALIMESIQLGAMIEKTTEMYR